MLRFEISKSLDTQHIQFNICIENVSLDLNKAIPCGLILNELLTNAAKHAFKSGGTGQVDITIGAHKQQVRLSVKDNGPGIPLEVRGAKGSLGLNIVNMLTEQLSGSVEIQNENGAEVIVTFPQGD